VERKRPLSKILRLLEKRGGKNETIETDERERGWGRGEAKLLWHLLLYGARLRPDGNRSKENKAVSPRTIAI